MAKEKVIKTNAIRMLDKAKVPYVHRSWEQATGQHTGVELAAALGQNPEQVFKTLVTVAKSGEHYVFLVPVAEELDLKKAAAAVGEKAISMCKSKDLLALTGYIHGGCSPIGMKNCSALPFMSPHRISHDLVQCRQDRTPAGTVTGQFAAGRALSAGGHHRGESTMRYCCTVFQRVGTCYHEFRKGSFRQGSSHWSSDSLLLHDNILQRSGFGKILQETLPAYNQYGITVVNWTQWQCILQHALAQGGGAELVALEVNEWAEDTFRDHAVFTILGI